MFDLQFYNNCKAMEFGIDSSATMKDHYYMRSPGIPNNGKSSISAEGFPTSNALARLSSTQMASLVSSVEGGRYQKYAQEFERRGVTGAVFLSLSENDLEDDFGITDKYQRRALLLLKVPSALPPVATKLL